MPDGFSRAMLMAILEDIDRDKAERPLHVRVAEALGCKVKEHYAPHPVYPHKIEGPLVHLSCGCGKHGTSRTTDDGAEEWDGNFARYDTSWEATGPLIEKYGIQTRPEWLMTNPPKVDGWRAVDREGRAADGKTLLEAVCQLILALHAAGELK